jgi:hypothetical protein
LPRIFGNQAPSDGATYPRRNKSSNKRPQKPQNSQSKTFSDIGEHGTENIFHIFKPTIASQGFSALWNSSGMTHIIHTYTHYLEYRFCSNTFREI